MKSGSALLGFIFRNSDYQIGQVKFLYRRSCGGLPQSVYSVKERLNSVYRDLSSTTCVAIYFGVRVLIKETDERTQLMQEPRRCLFYCLGTKFLVEAGVYGCLLHVFNGNYRGFCFSLSGSFQGLIKRLADPGIAFGLPNLRQPRLMGVGRILRKEPSGPKSVARSRSWRAFEDSQCLLVIHAHPRVRPDRRPRAARKPRLRLP